MILITFFNFTIVVVVVGPSKTLWKLNNEHRYELIKKATTKTYYFFFPKVKTKKFHTNTEKNHCIYFCFAVKKKKN